MLKLRKHRPEPSPHLVRLIVAASFCCLFIPIGYLLHFWLSRAPMWVFAIAFLISAVPLLILSAVAVERMFADDPRVWAVATIKLFMRAPGVSAKVREALGVPPTANGWNIRSTDLLRYAPRTRDPNVVATLAILRRCSRRDGTYDVDEIARSSRELAEILARLKESEPSKN